MQGYAPLSCLRGDLCTVPGDGEVEPFGPRRRARVRKDHVAIGRRLHRRPVVADADRLAGGHRVEAAPLAHETVFRVMPVHHIDQVEQLECGQHEDPQAPEVAYRAIVQTLALLGLTGDTPAPPAPGFQLLTLVDVVDRQHPDDRFVRDWSSFDPVVAGEPIGVRHDGTTVAAPADGHVVFPNPRAVPGAEWFYFARPGHRAQIPAKTT